MDRFSRYASHGTHILEDEYYMARQGLLLGHSHRMEVDLIRSPSPAVVRRERKLSVSSRSSRSSDIRHRRKVESPALEYR